MTYLVYHYNLGLTSYFDTESEAKDYIVKACFEAVLYHKERLVATFSPIGGWR